jgi:hypothetical protein
VRRLWRRCGCAALLAIGLAGLTAVPAGAGDDSPFFGPLEVRIFGANGDLRDFVARSADDRRGATALVDQIAGAIQGPAQPIEEAAIMLPHYRIGVSHLALTYVTTPWARISETSFIYFPSEQGVSFLVVAFARGDASVEQRWIAPSPQVAALLERHLQSLPPIGMESAARGTAAEPWNIALGAMLLASLSLILLPDPRRWRLIEKRRSAGKGDINRRSEISAPRCGKARVRSSAARDGY